MSRRIVFGDRSQPFHWVDVVNPSRAELEAIGHEYGLHPTSVHDCLDPEHLPKFESFGDIAFTILRSYDEHCATDADSVQELTRKVALFVGPNFAITVHRKDQPVMVALRERWSAGAPASSAVFLADVLTRILSTYELPTDAALDRLDALETHLFRGEAGPELIQEAYFIKRRASVVKRMLRMSIDILPRMFHSVNGTSPQIQEVKDTGDRVFFYADELQEGVNALVNLHISLSSQRTNEASHRANEVMRLLTVFSVFFMPLNFIAGLYGMNFEHMPELKTDWGYPIVLASMIFVTLAIFVWFRRRGWLKRQ